MFQSIVNSVSTAAARAGKGALAGVLATAAMTASSTAEMKLRGRSASDAPSKAAGRVLGVQPRNPEGAARFGNFVHWSYGTGWGAVGGILHGPLEPAVATLTHFGSVWGTEVMMLPALDVAPPLPEWGEREIAIDIFHHAVYVVAFAAAWALLQASDDRPAWKKLFSS